MKKTFLGFLKWHFVYISNLQFPNDSFKECALNNVNTIPQRWERLPFIIISYIILLGSIVFFIFNTQFYKYIVLILGAMSSIVFLLTFRFSFIYYIVLYKKYSNKDRSLNDKIIYESGILFDTSKDIRKIINKYFKLKYIGGNIFAVKFYLAKRMLKVLDNKKKITILDKKYIVLKIKSNKIYFNKKLVATTLSDISQLEDILIENS